jgi:hypothetical protein
MAKKSACYKVFSLKVDIYLVGQKYFRRLWNQFVHYRVHNSPLLYRILSQLFTIF